MAAALVAATPVTLKKQHIMVRVAAAAYVMKIKTVMQRSATVPAAIKA